MQVVGCVWKLWVLCGSRGCCVEVVGDVVKSCFYGILWLKLS